MHFHCFSDGGRLVVITGISFTRSNPKFTKFFASLKQKSDIILRDILPKGFFVKYRTSADTRIAVIDKGVRGRPCITSEDSNSLKYFVSTVFIFDAKRADVVIQEPIKDLFVDITNGNLGNPDANLKNLSMKLGNPAIKSDNFNVSGEVFNVKYTYDVPEFLNEDDGIYHQYLPNVLTLVEHWDTHHHWYNQLQWHRLYRYLACIYQKLMPMSLAMDYCPPHN